MAEQNDDAAEKEFEASESKRRKAREDGNVPQSKETNGFAVVLGILCAMLMLNYGTGEGISKTLQEMFRHADSYSADIFAGRGEQTRTWVGNIMLGVLPIFAVMAAFTVAVIAITQSFTFSTKKIKPDIKKISIPGNIKKKYGVQGLTDFGKDMLKMVFAGTIASIFLLGFARNYYLSSSIQTGNIGGFTFQIMFQLILAFCAFQFLLALLDLPLQWRIHSNKLKMTREELKKESKESEGDPHLKQSRQRKAAEISRNQMLQDVKTSTVVMVNPEHYAVALRWDPASDNAPILVAKGIDELAAKIREIAKDNGVPIYSDPPSTRSIYRSVELDQEIKPEHFRAVAAAIQFVERVAANTHQD